MLRPAKAGRGYFRKKIHSWVFLCSGALTSAYFVGLRTSTSYAYYNNLQYEVVARDKDREGQGAENVLE